MTSKAKGSGGEREVRRILDTHEVNHVWHGWGDQRSEGGLADIETDRFCIEVKRRAKGPFKAEWLDQAERAASKAGKKPAVVFRFDYGRRWRVRVLAGFDDRLVEAEYDFDDWLEAELV